MIALKNYSQKLVELKVFKTLNKAILTELEEKESELENLKKELINEVKEIEKDEENDIIKATYVEKYRKFYDYDTFIETADKKEFKVLKEAKGIKTEIDKNVFEECVNQGLISGNTKQASYKETLLNKSVLIKIKI